jgi:transcription elongation factor GreA
MAEQIYLTPEGKEKLEKELKELVEVKRPQLAAKLKEAIAQGDLSENADYIDSKEQQGLLESRIRDLESMLRAATIIEEKEFSGVVQIGSQVTVIEEGEQPESYRIVGAAEADPSKGLISNESPLGSALLNKKKGAKVKVSTPGGVVIFTIKDVQ